MTSTNPCFILIRGMLREGRHWAEFADILQKQFPTAIIHTPDIPGNGNLYHLISPNNVYDLTEGLRAQITVRHKVNLVAISMGGMIAIDWMTRYPEEIKSAVLINTSVRPCSPFYQRLRWQKYPAILKMLCQSKIRQEQVILELTSNRHQDNRNLLKLWQQWQQQCPVSSSSALNQLLAAAKFVIKTKPRQPILIIASKADRLVDYHCSLKLSHIWQTDLQQHESAGHDIPLDDPEWLAGVIREWLNQL